MEKSTLSDGSNLPFMRWGRAAALIHAPRLIDLRQGERSHPSVTLVGKRVCFDTGGLNLKPGATMRRMKKASGVVPFSWRS